MQNPSCIAQNDPLRGFSGKRVRFQHRYSEPAPLERKRVCEQVVFSVYVRQQDIPVENHFAWEVGGLPGRNIVRTVAGYDHEQRNYLAIVSLNQLVEKHGPRSCLELTQI